MRRDSSTPNCRPTDAVPASRSPRRSASRARRSASVTPNTARRITSSVIACIRGWSANGSPGGPALDVARDRVAHDRLVRAHPLAVERRQHQPAPREVLAPLEQQQRPRPDDREQRDRAPGRQPVLAHGVERPDRVGVREHHHRRLEAEEAHAERVAEAAAAGLEERDRPQQPAQRLDARAARTGRAGACVSKCRLWEDRPRLGARNSPAADGVRRRGAVACSSHRRRRRRARVRVRRGLRERPLPVPGAVAGRPDGARRRDRAIRCDGARDYGRARGAARTGAARQGARRDRPAVRRACHRRGRSRLVAA